MTSSHSRQLRHNQTEAEHRLWSRLRDRQLAGQKFRRQVALGPFVVDFVCFAGRLIVELDGGQHAEATQRHYDDERTLWLQNRGYRLLRFWNDEVMENIDGVLTAIAEALHSR